MTPTEIKAVFIIIVVVIGLCLWLLYHAWRGKQRIEAAGGPPTTERYVYQQGHLFRESQVLDWAFPSPDYHRPPETYVRYRDGQVI